MLFDLIRPTTTPALVCPDDGLSLTHEDVASLVTELAGRLATAGVQKGDRIAIVLPNGPEIVLCLFAIGLLGAVAGPLNQDYTEAEFRFYLSDLAPRFVIAGSVPQSRTRSRGCAQDLAGGGRSGAVAGPLCRR